MANEQITFDKLPQAVGYLTEQMEQLTKLVKSHERRSLPFTRLRVKD